MGVGAAQLRRLDCLRASRFHRLRLRRQYLPSEPELATASFQALTSKRVAVRGLLQMQESAGDNSARPYRTRADSESYLIRKALTAVRRHQGELDIRYPGSRRVRNLMDAICCANAHPDPAFPKSVRASPGFLFRLVFHISPQLGWPDSGWTRKDTSTLLRVNQPKP